MRTFEIKMTDMPPFLKSNLSVLESSESRNLKMRDLSACLYLSYREKQTSYHLIDLRLILN